MSRPRVALMVVGGHGWREQRRRKRRERAIEIALAVALVAATWGAVFAGTW